jgi:acyl-CoA synthetase (NDP forming)
LLPARVRDLAISSGGAPMQGLKEALHAFAATERFARLRDRLGKSGMDGVTVPPTPKPQGETRLLSEYEAKQQLSAYGLSVPDARVVAPSAAAAAASELGFPVVLKVAEPVLAHKTEAGAVAVNLKSAAEVEAALARMSTALGQYKPGATIAKVLVEKMVGDVVAELIIGVKRDPQFGLALVIGAGGILVEMVQDSAMLLLPTDRNSIETAIDGLKISKLLKGYRGRPAGDLRAVANAVAAVAAFAESHRGNLLELDVNPLMVLKTGAVAVDALVVLAEG